MTPDVPIDESKLNPGQRAMLRLMREAHIPITRENYINVACTTRRAVSPKEPDL